MRTTWFSRYILPGLILKAAIIGGGYVSGRELEQYFGGHGVVSGLMGMLITMLIWSCVYAATLEFARVHQSYDYRNFFKDLLGRGWPVFEIAYVLMTLTIISVLTSVAGNTFNEVTGWSVLDCEIAFMAAVAFLLFFGTNLVERFLSLWSFVLYTAFAVLVICSFIRFGPQIMSHVETDRFVESGVVVRQGLKYAGYNIQAMTAVLFCARHIRNRRDALVGGLLGGPLAMLPGMFFFIAMSGVGPEIKGKTVPVEYLLDKLAIPVLRVSFLAVMTVTLAGTCCALIHAVNERIAQSPARDKREYPGWARAATAGFVMVFTVFVADRIGLVMLVGKAYGLMAWIFIAVFMIPILTLGVWKIARRTSVAAAFVRQSAPH